MERPDMNSDAGKDEAQEAAEFADPAVLDQQEKPEGTTDDEKKSDRRNAAAPRPADPQKKSDPDKGLEDDGNGQEGEEGMGKEE